MSRLSPGLSALVAGVLNSHPSLHLLPISRYTPETVAVYGSSAGRVIAHLVRAPDRQSLLVGLAGLDYVGVCDIEHDLLVPAQEPASLMIPELRRGLLVRLHPTTAGDVCRVVAALESA